MKGTLLYRPLLFNHSTMDDEWENDDAPSQTFQKQGKWSSSQKVCIRSFSEQWNTKDADRKVILPTIVTALLALPDPPTLQNLGSVCRSTI